MRRHIWLALLAISLPSPFLFGFAPKVIDHLVLKHHYQSGLLVSGDVSTLFRADGTCMDLVSSEVMSRRQPKSGAYIYSRSSSTFATIQVVYSDGESRNYQLVFQDTLEGSATWASGVSQGPFKFVPASCAFAFKNLSTRGLVASVPLIGGFVIEGDLPRRVLVRGVGAGLKPLGVSEAASDTTLELFDVRGGSIAANDDWGSTADFKSLQDSVGAFPLEARDAALVVMLWPGAYTAHVRTKSPGEVLLEVYLLP
jgi:hypothetical protein